MSATCHRHGVDYFGLVRPRPGYHVAGDAAVVVPHDGKLLAAILDVLGHGPEAHDVAIRAQCLLDQGPTSDSPVELITALHRALKGTRGAAAGLGVLDTATGLLRYAGVGNTVIRRFGEKVDRLVPTDGILGGNIRTPREQRMTLGRGDTVVMYSDGVRDHFDLREYPQLTVHDTETIARTVIRRFAKDHDDASCIAVRYKP